MEVQDRPLLETRRLSERFAAAGAWRWPALAFATVVTVAVLIVDAQPLRSPWWTYADADATYTASALNLMLGRDVSFVDHPGLPITEAVAVAFAVETVIDRGSLSEASRLAYTDATLLELDSARLTFRGFAVVFYLLGAALAFVLAARLFRHWTWGLAAGLLWIAAPGLAAMSIQLRPDVLLAALTIVFAYVVARAADERSLGWYASAGATVGFAAMVKLHALALLPALALAAVWRPALDVDPRGTLSSARAWALRHRVLAASVAAVVAGSALLINALRLPYSLTNGQVLALVLLGGVTAAVVAVGEVTERTPSLRSLRRFTGRTTASVVAGIAAGAFVPILVSIPEGLRALVYIATNISGRGVQEGVDSFSTPFSHLEGIVGQRVLLLFGVAAAAAAIGLARRDPRPVVWSAAALAMGVMAFARAPNVHYFAPSFVLAVFAMLWLVGGRWNTRAAFLVWPVVLYLVWPTWDTRGAAAAEQERFAGVAAPAKAFVDERLGPGEVALVPSYWPFADARFFELVQIYVEHTPAYPYRYLPATAAVPEFASVRGLRPRFYVSPAVAVAQPTPLPVGELGEYLVAPTGQPLVGELQQGRGVTEPW